MNNFDINMNIYLILVISTQSLIVLVAIEVASNQ